MEKTYRLASKRRPAAKWVLLVVLALGACASPAEMQNMIVDQSQIVAASPDTPFKNAIAVVQVDGGEKTNPLWTSEVDGPAYRGALEASLGRSGLLATPDASARFDLYAVLASVEQPMFGLDLAVASRIDYRVVDRKTRKTWFDESILASHTATFGDSPLAVQRLRFANEGSIRENIKLFIQRLLTRKAPLN